MLVVMYILKLTHCACDYGRGRPNLTNGRFFSINKVFYDVSGCIPDRTGVHVQCIMDPLKNADRKKCELLAKALNAVYRNCIYSLHFRYTPCIGVYLQCALQFNLG